MADITQLHGEAAISAASEAEFSGMLSPRRYRISPELAERADLLLSEAFQGVWGADVKLAEAFATDDFKLAAFGELDKEMVAQYNELPSVWTRYSDETRVNDFRPKPLRSRWDGSVGLARVPELTEYPADTPVIPDGNAISVYKYGRRFAISWEAWKNGEAAGELEDLPGVQARQARETEAINAVSNLLKVGENNTAEDVNTDFFKVANGNAPSNLPLTRENLKKTVDALRVKKDKTTKRIVAAPELVLVVPKALESAALAIVAPREVRITQGGVTTVQNNEFASLTYVVEPMLDYVNQHEKAATTWFLVPKPGGPRPALWTAKLRGYEEPDLRVKASTGQRAGGGTISPLDGSFEVDDIQYRVRHIVGHQTGDPTFTFCSYGS